MASDEVGAEEGMLCFLFPDHFAAVGAVGIEGNVEDLFIAIDDCLVEVDVVCQQDLQELFGAIAKIEVGGGAFHVSGSRIAVYQAVQAPASVAAQHSYGRTCRQPKWLEQVYGQGLEVGKDSLAREVENAMLHGCRAIDQFVEREMFGHDDHTSPGRSLSPDWFADSFCDTKVVDLTMSRIGV